MFPINLACSLQILGFLILSIVLSLSKNRPVYFSKHNVSETGFCLRLQAKPTQLGQVDTASPCLRRPDRIKDKDNICTKVPLSQTFTSYSLIHVLPQKRAI
jgi:hypothetical protein